MFKISCICLYNGFSAWYKLKSIIISGMQQQSFILRIFVNSLKYVTFVLQPTLQFNLTLRNFIILCRLVECFLLFCHLANHELPKFWSSPYMVRAPLWKGQVTGPWFVSVLKILILRVGLEFIRWAVGVIDSAIWMRSCCTCHFLIVYRWFRYLSPDPIYIRYSRRVPPAGGVW